MHRADEPDLITAEQVVELIGEAAKLGLPHGRAGEFEAVKLEKGLRGYRTDNIRFRRSEVEEWLRANSKDLERLTKSRDPRFADEAGAVNLVRKDGGRWRSPWWATSCGVW